MSFPPLGGNTFQFRPKGRSIWLLFLLGGRGWLSVHPPLWISASKDMVQARSKSEMGKKSFLSANPPRPLRLPSLYSTYLPLTKISFWGSLYIYYVYIYIYILRKRYSFSIYIMYIYIYIYIKKEVLFLYIYIITYIYIYIQ